MFILFQGSIKCKARAITRVGADGTERLIHRSFEHNHTPKEVDKILNYAKSYKNPYDEFQITKSTESDPIDV